MPISVSSQRKSRKEPSFDFLLPVDEKDSKAMKKELKVDLYQ